jgi:hypothetical protein
LKIKYICEKCGKGFECRLEVEDGCEHPYSCPYAVEEKDEIYAGWAKWIEFKESKNMKNKDKFVICKLCWHNDETDTACRGCVSGSNFELKDVFNNCTECNCEQSSPENDAGHSHNRDCKPEENTRGKILRRALDIINGERQDQYGNPEDSFALIGKYWTEFLKANGVIVCDQVIISPKEVAEMMMLFKVARMSGQKPSLDNYLDLVGYAGIAADMVEEEL